MPRLLQKPRKLITLVYKPPFQPCLVQPSEKKPSIIESGREPYSAADHKKELEAARKRTAKLRAKSKALEQQQMANATAATNPWKSQSDSGATRQRISNYTNPRRGLKVARANAALIAAQRAVFNQQSARRLVPSRPSNDPLEYSSSAPTSTDRGTRLQGEADALEVALSTLLTGLSIPRIPSELKLANIQHKAAVASMDSPQRIGLLLVCLVALWVVHSRMAYFFAAFIICAVKYTFLQYSRLKTQERVLLKTLPTGEGYGVVYAEATY
ncbi:uncharacterized protein K441DRAFT_695562 [Cenococcum geophilum 1.58]|uniref:uncharacterized protein n=1 Tax=Cenococcum geophilum 1.58 TaxID=794803 RepID=UPI00358F66CD|nr:hypothetical protein K441DRAFT_695562 [Cenococcum geophilum 1.58]